MRPPPRDGRRYFNTLPRGLLLFLASLFFLQGLLLTLVTGDTLGLWARGLTLGSAPTQDAVIRDVLVVRSGRGLRRAQLLWSLSAHPERITAERVVLGVTSDAAPLAALKRGDTVAVHVGDTGMISAPLREALRPWDLLGLHIVLSLTTLLMLPALIEVLLIWDRVRRWPVLLARPVRVSPSRVELRYSISGRELAPIATLTEAEVAAWREQCGAAPGADLPIFIHPEDPTRWRMCRAEARHLR